MCGIYGVYDGAGGVAQYRDVVWKKRAGFSSIAVPMEVRACRAWADAACLAIPV